jgi:hypothetical protein
MSIAVSKKYCALAWGITSVRGGFSRLHTVLYILPAKIFKKVKEIEKFP